MIFHWISRDYDSNILFCHCWIFSNLGGSRFRQILTLKRLWDYPNSRHYMRVFDIVLTYTVSTEYGISVRLSEANWEYCWSSVATGVVVSKWERYRGEEAQPEDSQKAIRSPRAPSGGDSQSDSRVNSIGKWPKSLIQPITTLDYYSISHRANQRECKIRRETLNISRTLRRHWSIPNKLQIPYFYKFYEFDRFSTLF